MKEAVRVDDEDCSRQQDLLSRLATENKGLRELLDIAQRSSSGPRLKKLDCASLHKEVQTERAESPGTVEQEVSVTLPMPPPPRRQQPAAPAPSPPAQLADNSGTYQEGGGRVRYSYSYTGIRGCESGGETERGRTPRPPRADLPAGVRGAAAGR